MEKLMILAMKLANESPPILWYDDTMIVAVLTKGIDLKWVKRISYTQIQWTEKGAEQYKHFA